MSMRNVFLGDTATSFDGMLQSDASAMAWTNETDLSVKAWVDVSASAFVPSACTVPATVAYSMAPSLEGPRSAASGCSAKACASSMTSGCAGDQAGMSMAM